MYMYMKLPVARRWGKEDNEKAIIYMIQNPANDVDQFMFDDGWQQYARMFPVTK